MSHATHWFAPSAVPLQRDDRDRGQARLWDREAIDEWDDLVDVEAERTWHERRARRVFVKTMGWLVIATAIASLFFISERAAAREAITAWGTMNQWLIPAEAQPPSHR